MTAYRKCKIKIKCRRQSIQVRVYRLLFLAFDFSLLDFGFFLVWAFFFVVVFFELLAVFSGSVRRNKLKSRVKKVGFDLSPIVLFLVSSCGIGVRDS